MEPSWGPLGPLSGPSWSPLGALLEPSWNRGGEKSEEDEEEEEEEDVEEEAEREREKERRREEHDPASAQGYHRTKNWALGLDFSAARSKIPRSHGENLARPQRRNAPRQLSQPVNMPSEINLVTWIRPTYKHFETG